MFIPVILSGGAGTRLWPVSRETHPKPFMRLNDGQSLLQKTLQRALKLNEVAEILTVTNRELYFKTRDEYSMLDTATVKQHFLLEPFGRNTAPAIGLAALYALDKYGPESVLLILPADHLIAEQTAFDTAVQHAHRAAKTNKLVTFGIKPTLPETGFGYVKFHPTQSAQTTYPVAAFIEKPSRELAEQYIQSELYLWNSGMFCFKTETLLAQLENLAPHIFNATQTCWKKSKTRNTLNDTVEIDMETFRETADISIDYAVMEKAQDVVVVPCEFNWSDIGSWHAVSELVAPDAAGNRVIGEALLVDVADSFVHSHERLVAMVGVENLIIVDTADALLIADAKRSQDVKMIVQQLKQDNHDSYKIHRTVFRPWGTYTTLEEGERFKIKRIVVKPNAALSLQMHHHRSEHWVVVSGVAKVTNDTHTFMLNTNESTFISAGHKHRLENPGLVDLILIEVQTGEYLGEDDIVRFEDQYGRN